MSCTGLPPAIPALQKLRQENGREFETSLGVRIKQANKKEEVRVTLRKLRT